MNRRTLLLGGAAVGVGALRPLFAQTMPSIHVVKDSGCPCCSAWIGHVRDNGFPVSIEVRSVEALALYKREKGIPAELAACHTATVEGYVLEGHVPTVDIRRVLRERPAAVGLAVPGMPYGSPGMGPETEREAYDVVLVEKDGSGKVFTSYPAA